MTATAACDGAVILNTRSGSIHVQPGERLHPICCRRCAR